MGRKANSKLAASGIYLCVICDDTLESTITEPVCRCCGQPNDFVAIYVEEDVLVQSCFSEMDFIGG